MSDNTDTKVSDLEDKLNKALESIQKLEAKNKELITEKQKANDAADAAAAEADQAAEDKARADNDLKALEEKLTAKHTRELAKITKDYEAAQGQLSTLLIDNAISQALDGHNVLPQFKKAVTSMIKSEAKLDGGEAFAGNLPLVDYIKDFVSSEDGKHFVAAPANSGAAVTTQSTTSTTNHGYTKENFDSRIGEWLMLEKSDPTAAAAIAKSVGRNDLI